MSRAALMVVLVALAGCRPPASSPPPDDSYREFASAFAQGDDDGAWSLLSSATQANLTRAAKAAAAAEHVKAPDDGRILMFESDKILRKVKDVSLAHDDGDRATLNVVDDAGGHEQVAMVREAGAWKVDLTSELAKAEAAAR